jgi:hypothetical protein
MTNKLQLDEAHLSSVCRFLLLLATGLTVEDLRKFVSLSEAGACQIQDPSSFVT